MEKINYFKVMSLLHTYKGKTLQINVVGAVSIPFIINCFDYVEYQDAIAYGESEEDQGSWFWINKAELCAWNHYDRFESMDSLIFRLVLDEPDDFTEEDILVSYVVIMCPFEGIEMIG